MPARTMLTKTCAGSRTALTAVGTSPQNAGVVADSLVDANLAGHDSHGVIRLSQYIKAAQDGHVHACQEPVVIRTEAATATIDACDGWGEPGMRPRPRRSRSLPPSSGLRRRP